MKLQNGLRQEQSGSENKETARLSEPDVNFQNQKNSDAQAIQLLEMQIKEKKKTNSDLHTITEELQKKSSNCTSVGDKSTVYNSSGLDESVFNEEMEWIREMKIQNGIEDSSTIHEDEASSIKEMQNNSEETQQGIKKGETSSEALAIKRLETLISFKRSDSKQNAEVNVENVKHKSSCNLIENAQVSLETSSTDHLSNGQSNCLGLDESIFQEEMEWVKEMKLQKNTNDYNNMANLHVSVTSPVSSKEDTSPANQINELERQKCEKMFKSKPDDRQNSTLNTQDLKEQSNLHTTNGHNNSLGLEDSILQEEMEWIREVKSQNIVSTTSKPEKISSPVLPKRKEISKNNEANKIFELERQISEKISRAKAEEAAKRKQEKESEDQEFLQRLQEEMDIAEEMKKIAEEENEKRIQEEERNRKAIEDEKIEEERRKKIQDEKDMISKLEKMVLQKLSKSK